MKPAEQNAAMAELEGCNQPDSETVGGLPADPTVREE